MNPTLVFFPADDESFAGSCAQHLAGGADSVAELQRRLRPDYPRAIVHARELTGEVVTTWYVYRDGHWTA